MNFDFSENERKFHQALVQALAGLETPEKLQVESNATIPKWIPRFQRILAEEGFLNLGFKMPGQKAGDSLHLMASQEILAAFS